MTDIKIQIHIIVEELITNGQEMSKSYFKLVPNKAIVKELNSFFNALNQKLTATKALHDFHVDCKTI